MGRSPGLSNLISFGNMYERQRSKTEYKKIGTTYF